jgi:putative transcriptional regulator
MSRIHHHPEDDTIAGYAAGALPAALALVVGCHLQFCEHCRQRVAQAEATGGGLLSNVAPRPMGASRREAMLAALDDAPVVSAAVAASANRTQAASGDIPSLLRPLVSVDNFSDLPWKTIVPGMRHLPLDCGEGTLRLLNIGAGMKMPVHTHRGNELTLVLQGGYSDELGQFNAGDFADLDGSVEHQPVADSDRNCICLGGLDDKLQFRGWVAKFMQPFVGL